ncbi:ubiquitin-like activating enzyme (UbaB) [Penicillium alfredii]|uniref:Ubiquitin-activating enzyme E1-like n=1 Tax=Penicillium alfredii TaxID=1506179 RepID=A0A9W9KEN9_9EURO|nr:ubiquitin-like activating enzyme (UbaB) [Penicillium alfredii]KAJ5102272.1 ubiquitin-like activating enzyme (UbaB) [Penicillium alfredii]
MRGGSSFKRAVGVELSTTIQQSRVLLVGAGGIGCELLKNLVLSGFGEVHIIDLDTIDLSNLNRQFLFRHEHIKKSKALVARDVAQKFRPSAKLEAYHANIKDPQFNVDWFKSFNIVFNALDNLDARRYVNRMCLSAEVPLIESGTTGFNGQVQAIKKGNTECYDCTPKEVPKSFPVCTIRSTPSQPIHCIVWAKSYLLPELFGKSEYEAEELDTSENAENATEIEELRKEARILQDIRQSMGSAEFPQKVFEKVFKDDIERLRGMHDMWTQRKPPEALDFDAAQAESESIPPTISSNDQKVWSLNENFAVFKDSLSRLTQRLNELQKTSTDDQPVILTFDKDDEDTLDFVTATANLRAVVFDIPLKSKFDTKQMAGNIIPAIATTNAMTAGLCVLQAFKVLQDDLAHAKMVFLERSGARAINSDSLNRPNPECPVCSVAQGRVIVDSDRATLEDLVQAVNRMKLGYSKDNFAVTSSLGLLYDEDMLDNLPKKLSELEIRNDSFLTIIDEQDEDPRVNLELLVVEITGTAREDAVSLEQVFELPRKPRALQESTPEVAPTNGTLAIGKRKREADEIDMANDHAPKRIAGGPVAEGDGSDPIVLDDADGGAILID